MLNEISQAEKGTYSAFSIIHGLEDGRTYRIRVEW